MESENTGAKNCKCKDISSKCNDDKFWFGHVDFKMPVQCSSWKYPLCSLVIRKDVGRETELYAGDTKSSP